MSLKPASKRCVAGMVFKVGFFCEFKEGLVGLKSCLFFFIRKLYRLLNIDPQSFCSVGEICNFSEPQSASLCNAPYQPQEGAICMGIWVRVYV